MTMKKSDQVSNDQGIMSARQYPTANVPWKKNLKADGVGSSGVKKNGMGSNGDKEAGEGDKTPWVNLFKNNRMYSEEMKIDQYPKPDGVLHLEEDDVADIGSVWKTSLIGCFSGKPPGIGTVITLIKKWKAQCKVLPCKNGWIIFRFKTEDEKDMVMSGGPYSIFGRRLHLQNVPAEFLFEEHVFSTVPVWVQLPQLPFDCWTSKSLGKIGSMLGKPICTDRVTLQLDRVEYARIMVEMDVTKPPPVSVKIALPKGTIFEQALVYEDIPMFCSSCSKFGHYGGNCKIKGKETTCETQMEDEIGREPLNKDSEGTKITVGAVAEALDGGLAEGSNGDPVLVSVEEDTLIETGKAMNENSKEATPCQNIARVVGDSKGSDFPSTPVGMTLNLAGSEDSIGHKDSQSPWSRLDNLAKVPGLNTSVDVVIEPDYTARGRPQQKITKPYTKFLVTTPLNEAEFHITDDEGFTKVKRKKEKKGRSKSRNRRKLQEEDGLVATDHRLPSAIRQ